MSQVIPKLKPKLTRVWLPVGIILLIFSGIFNNGWLGSPDIAMAQTVSTSGAEDVTPGKTVSPSPALEASTLDQNTAVATESTISQDGLTPPSLWWTQDQFGGQLLETWSTRPGNARVPDRVDLVINEQIWDGLTYLERYAFVNQFGTAASDFGYNTRVVTNQGNRLAAYTCTFDRQLTTGEPYQVAAQSALPTPAIPLTCEIELDSQGPGAITGGDFNLFDAPQPTNDDTAQ